jgi:[ribosomal protein S18]-alanine N-acetyltransferase
MTKQQARALLPLRAAQARIEIAVMPARSRNIPAIAVRRARLADLDDLCELEELVFGDDRMSRRGLRNFLTAHSASVVVAEHFGGVAGCAVVLFRPNSKIARLYSIAVSPNSAGRGLGPALLAAAEQAAVAKRRQTLRLEVHERNHRAIARYRQAGYQQFGCHERYYLDSGDALRFEKRLQRSARRSKA